MSTTPAVVRLTVPVIVGMLGTAAVKTGVHIPTGVLTDTVTALLTAAYFAAAHWLEATVDRRFGWLLGKAAPATPGRHSTEAVTARLAAGDH